MRWHAGGCHCGAVRFEVQTPEAIEVDDCNCTMCAKTGFLHLIVPAARFRLLSGAELISTYTFNTGVAKHLFCKHCGVKAFYVPRSTPTATASTCAASTIRRTSATCGSSPSTVGAIGKARRTHWRTNQKRRVH
jgi:hypothetical protein